MKRSFLRVTLLGVALFPACASAQDAEPPASELTVTGNVSGVSEYRLRGISLSDEDPAIQGAITVSHASGFYAGAWGSSLAGYGTYGGANLEVDAFAGYTTTVGETTLDGGLIWYFYPGTSGHQYAEVYGSVTQPIGPAKAKIGAFYAPERRSIGDADNLWVYGDVSVPIANTPLSLRGHLGYTDGEGSIFSGPRGNYVDYALGADLTWRQLTFSLSYIGTDINHADADAFFTVPGARPGRDIVDDTLVLSVSAAL